MELLVHVACLPLPLVSLTPGLYAALLAVILGVYSLLRQRRLDSEADAKLSSGEKKQARERRDKRSKKSPVPTGALHLQSELDSGRWVAAVPISWGQLAIDAGLGYALTPRSLACLSMMMQRLQISILAASPAPPPPSLPNGRCAG